MRKTTMTRNGLRLAAAMLLAATLAAAPEAALAAPKGRPKGAIKTAPATTAQVVVMANGSPITELDIEQRSKLTASATHKIPARQEVINELIDDRLKIAKAKSYGLEVSEAEVDESFAAMAKRQSITAKQFAEILDKVGITANALKARIKAELTWTQLVRGKFSSSLQVADSDVANAMRLQNETANATVGYIYTLYPVMVVVGSGSGAEIIEAKRREAENLRARFVNCNEGLALARAVRDVAVRDPISRSSGDLPPQLRELLANMEVGHLTAPDVTPQGLQMFAVCSKKSSADDSPIKRDLREQIYARRFEAESRKYLDEIRKQAMIEYK